ncbi:site-specific DNA-methyltransferase [Hydrogenovibrio sp. 3SP14C1]|uniref:site-specific DNA-methyltransferase n=1 Tax=Hydrogenovibrio sp. 3SP14C1 TaxID=3038774 RepID=UPI0024168608|nr:site-specific DNA-methyltransferase [Hydrogenovibrio sp. 3SP14C1]MDG4812024.1 site-specific DNA-methyltransferase [Hydrogenovibrio sp. 3SP14C1]
MTDTQNDYLQQLPGKSMDLTEHNTEQLKLLFPNVFSEGKIDFEALKSELGEAVEESNERYQFTWAGKEQAKRIATTPTLGTLRPAPEESVNWDTTENMYIEGDNLEVLKLLQKSYFGKIKMIYIDPPYNTGNDFVYKDDFKDNLANYQRLTVQKDDEGNPLTTNTDSSGRYHSNWLNMMYPRLKLARNLLKDDGVIFISIDDNEAHNLKKICDEIFGEGNFIAQLAVQLNPRGRHLDKFIAKTHESILVYGKNINLASTIFGVEKEGSMVEEYNREDSRGKYRLLGLRNRNQAFNPQTRPKLYYPVYVNPQTGDVSLDVDAIHTDEVFPDTPDGIKTCWTWGKEKFVNENILLTAEKTGNEWRVYRKDYLYDESGKSATTLPKSLWIDKEINNDYGRKEIKSLFEGNSVMDFPKSIALIEKLIKSGSRNNSIILDFFSGSATTAHTVMKLNTEDKGNRKFIMVQIPEPTSEKSEARKANYETIPEIGKERIRRAAKKIKEEHPDTQADLGFKAFKLDTSNIKKWQPNLDDLENDLLDAVDNILPDRTAEDLLYEVLIKYGLPLTLPIASIKVGIYQAWSVANNSLVACFDENITLETVQAIAGLSTPENPVLRVVFRDTSFTDDITKTNAIQRLKQAGIEDVLSI